MQTQAAAQRRHQVRSLPRQQQQHTPHVVPQTVTSQPLLQASSQSPAKAIEASQVTVISVSSAWSWLLHCLPCPFNQAPRFPREGFANTLPIETPTSPTPLPEVPREGSTNTLPIEPPTLLAPLPEVPSDVIEKIGASVPSLDPAKQSLPPKSKAGIQIALAPNEQLLKLPLDQQANEIFSYVTKCSTKAKSRFSDYRNDFISLLLELQKETPFSSLNFEAKKSLFLKVDNAKDIEWLLKDTIEKYLIMLEDMTEKNSELSHYVNSTKEILEELEKHLAAVKEAMDFVEKAVKAYDIQFHQ